MGRRLPVRLRSRRRSGLPGRRQNCRGRIVGLGKSRRTALGLRCGVAHIVRCLAGRLGRPPALEHFGQQLVTFHQFPLKRTQLVDLRHVGVLVEHQPVIDLVDDRLQRSKAILVGDLHLQRAALLGRDDLVLERDVHRREGQPEQPGNDHRGQDTLDPRPQRDELDLAFAAQVDLALAEGMSDTALEAVGVGAHVTQMVDLLVVRVSRNPNSKPRIVIRSVGLTGGKRLENGKIGADQPVIAHSGL